MAKKTIQEHIAHGHGALSPAVELGMMSNASTIHKFGHNLDVGTSLEVLATGGNYRTPTAAVTIEAVSSSANDTSAGTGAQEITVQYLTSDFTYTVGTIEMNGTSASTETLTDVLRITRVFVSRSGTYATQTSGSHAGTITLREEGAGQTWVTIPVVDSFGLGQSLIGCYTVPAGKTAYILGIDVSTDSTKTVDIYFFQRQNADDVTAPYSGVMRVTNAYVGIQGGPHALRHLTNESYPEKTDIGFLAKVGTGSASVSAEFEMLLVDN